VVISQDSAGVITAAINACDKGRRTLFGRGPVRVVASVRGREVPVPEAVEAAAELLRRAESPAVLGVTGLTVEAAREAVALAELLRGIIAPWPPDPTREWGHAPPAPDLTRTWTEILNRCDLIVFWRCDPDRDAPRWVERYIRRRADGPREIVLVDERLEANLTDEHTANHAFAWPASDDVKWLRMLRAHLELGEPLHGEAARLAKLLTAAKAAHVLLSPESAADAAVVGQWQMLAAKRLPAARFGVSVLPRSAGGRTASEVLTWQTGFAGPVGFGSAAPAWRPHVWEADRLLTDRLIDVAVCAGLNASGLPPLAAEALKQIPRIAIGPASAEDADAPADVAFAVPGPDPRLDAHVIRLDGVMLRLCGGPDSPGLPDPAAGVLSALTAALRG
jgi:formylmethanofuran dehydrogenase subunit B